MISSAIEFPDLEILQLESDNVTSSVCSMRERYSFLAMMLIHPFRSMDDLKDSHDNLYWTKFGRLRDRKQLREDGL